MQNIPDRLKAADKVLSRYKVLWGFACALVLSALVAVFNINDGPLRNLNDIGNWHNRQQFLIFSFAAQCLILSAAAFLHQEGAAKLLLKQLLLTFCFLLYLEAINQKSFDYVRHIQPVVRIMDSEGLSCLSSLETRMSSPALTLLYLVTRGSIYDMYLVKLFTILVYFLLCLTGQRAASDFLTPHRKDAMLVLLLILPQAFLCLACTGQIDVLAVLLLLLGMTEHKRHSLISLIAFGLAAALTSASWLFLLAYALFTRKWRIQDTAVVCLVVMLCCLPACIAGMPPQTALLSLLRAHTTLPEIASGAPNIVALIPYPEVEGIPEYGLLWAVPEIDAATNAFENYTMVHYAGMVAGYTVAGIAAYMALLMHLKNRKMDPLKRALVVATAALMATPNISISMWLAVAGICVAVLLACPEARLPACLLLFVTASGAIYPVTQETTFYPAWGCLVCLAALMMLMDVMPAVQRKEEP